MEARLEAKFENARKALKTAKTGKEKDAIVENLLKILSETEQNEIISEIYGHE